MPGGSSSSSSGDAAAAGGGGNTHQPEQQEQPPPETAAGGGGDDDDDGGGGRGRGGGGDGDDNEDDEYEDEEGDEPPPEPPASSAAAAAGGVFGGLFGARAGTGAGGGGGGGGQGGATAVLTLRNYGPGHTFVLAGFLKILTLGSVASGAPSGAHRTAAGEASPYLLVPGALALCAAAKYAVDSRLVEVAGFYPALAACLALLYFGLGPLLYRYDGDYGDLKRRVLSPRPRMGRMGRGGSAMAEAGGRELITTAAAAAGDGGGGSGDVWGRRTSRAVGQLHDPDEYYRRGRYVTADQKRREQAERAAQDQAR
jgi:hypothetical protein